MKECLDYKIYWKDIKNKDEAIFKIINQNDITHKAKEDNNTIKGILEKEKIDFKKFNVAELGCGMGRIMKIASNLFNRIDGYDISKQEIEYATEYCRNIKNVDFIFMEEDSKIPNKISYDLIYSYIVLQHIPKHIAFQLVRECHRILKLDGWALLHFCAFENNPEYATLYKDYMFQGGDNVPRMFFYFEEELRFLFSYLGFDNIKLYKYANGIFVLGQKLKANTKINEFKFKGGE